MDHSTWYSIRDFLFSPIQKYLKLKRLEAIAKVADASKSTDAGHRVYLRCMTILELELGIDNKKNYEVSEGYLQSTQDLVSKKDDESEDNREEDVLFNEGNRDV